MNKEKIEQNWKLKTEMVSLSNIATRVCDEDDKYRETLLSLLKHIDKNLDTDDKQYLCMAIDCLPLDEDSYNVNKKLYQSICKKYEGKKFDSIRTAIRVSALELMIQRVDENKKTKSNFKITK